MQSLLSIDAVLVQPSTFVPSGKLWQSKVHSQVLEHMCIRHQFASPKRSVCVKKLLIPQLCLLMHLLILYHGLLTVMSLLMFASPDSSKYVSLISILQCAFIRVHTSVFTVMVNTNCEWMAVLMIDGVFMKACDRIH